ncbi:PIG-L deacetylase family protein [Natronosalvus halobius]|uniref:PIG-L deacetylase family protein n=1 Tax=Natronosalvus halobius TaxID=2953746 RepID=UPI0020A0767E|nr:PIG-L family deacetylase [Natronosalvus halobius]USZ72429.1 PIG-L family deacetylase [Natronosalvus halobius]
MSRRLLVIGAHPDDPDIRAGGLACSWADAGHDVRFVSMTDGRSGHHEQGGNELAERRRREAAAAAVTAGIEYHVLENPDGRLEPTLENRETVIELIREYDPDLVLTHRTNDYHPDHRYTSQLVRDAAYMVTVPNVCPETPALHDNPVFAYLLDTFERPYPFTPDVIVPIDDEHVECKYDALDCHESQMYEWLPYNKGELEAVPDDPDDRREWLETDPIPGLAEMRATADRFRDDLIEQCGPERGRQVEYAEAFEVSEYGGNLTSALASDLVSP